MFYEQGPPTHSSGLLLELVRTGRSGVFDFLLGALRLGSRKEFGSFGKALPARRPFGRVLKATRWNASRPCLKLTHVRIQLLNYRTASPKAVASKVVENSLRCFCRATERASSGQCLTEASKLLPRAERERNE
jgi:hypothetical protein